MLLFLFLSQMHLAPAVVLQLLQSCYVSLCQIHNVDIISHTWRETENSVHMILNINKDVL